MTWRTNLTLLIVSVALTLYFRAFEAQPPSWDRLGLVFDRLEASEIVELELSQPAASNDAAAGADTRAIRLRFEGRHGGLPAWWLVEPIEFPAFHPRVRGLTGELADLVRVAEAPGAEVFDGPPQIRARFKTRDGVERTLDIGPDHPDATLGLCYARLGDETFTIRTRARLNLTVKLTDLRSRALVPISRDRMTAIELARAGERALRLERAKGAARDEGLVWEDRWRLVHPLESLADRDNVETLADALNSWTIREFVDDAATDDVLARAGLSPPRFGIEVSPKEGPAVRLEIGGDVPEVDGGTGERFVYVRPAGTRFLFAAERTLVDSLAKPVDEYRSRFVFDLGAAEVVRIEVDVLSGEAPPISFTLRRLEISRGERHAGEREHAERHAWRVETGDDTYAADRDRIAEVQRELRFLAIEKFVPPAERAASGVDEPRARVRFALDSGRELELLVGPKSTDPLDEGVEVYAVARADESGAYLVLSRLSRWAASGADEFRDRFLSDVEPTRVIEVTLQHGGRSWSAMRLPGEKSWNLSDETSIAPGLTLQSRLFDDLIEELHRDVFRAERFFSGEPTAASGLAGGGAVSTVAVEVDGPSARFRTLYIGNPVAGSSPLEYHARVDDAAVPVFTIGAKVPELARKIREHITAISSP